MAGARCGQYCALLIDDFGFSADKVSYLEGGILAWEAWEAENSELADAIRTVNGLPRSRGRAGARSDSESAALRELSLGFID